MNKKTLFWLKKNNFNPLDINMQDNYGNTALMKAAMEGNIDVFEDLLNNGADIFIKNNDGNSVLWFACFSNSKKIVETTNVCRINRKK
ncbi:ankyrin repeat domain-containing protein [Lebetimonas sp. JH292]|uniref:ankyrin repeat domain-containing protein n=1 Tax=Lebetimonas sp. JH292 TaxID=990068 RepID=UPI0004633BA1|nr:ankyrin repeat domain-containing protein [Lebetimonas sp. JH292]